MGNHVAFMKFFPLLLIPFCLAASVLDYLKPALDKDGFHQMRNIDFIYTINLDRRPEKFASCVNQLIAHGIEPYRFSAVNGWELTLDAINALGVELEPWMATGTWGTCYLPGKNGEPHHEPVYQLGRTYFCHCMSRGAIGIVLSHLSILQDAYDSSYETIWVMEDDIQVLRDPHLLSDLIDQLDALVGKEGWDLLFTDQDTKNNLGQYVPNTGFAWRPNYAPPNPSQFSQRSVVGPFRKVGARFGAYSMIVRRSGMEKILDFFKDYGIFLPYDIDFYMPPGIHLFSVINDVVSTQPGAPSDNGSPNYLLESR